MKRQEQILGFIDALRDVDLAGYLVKVIAWVTYPSRAETIARKEQAIDLLIKLQGSDAAAWCEPARVFLHNCGRDYPELASDWVVKNDQP